MSCIYLWDEICGEVREVDDAHPGEEPIEPEMFGETPSMIADGSYVGWQTDHVIDLPDGTRIVIESDDRAHTAVWVTQP